MRKIELYFDYECPYCMRAYESLMRQLANYDGVEIVFMPAETHPRPEDHPPHTDLCIQGCFMARDQGVDILKYNERMFNAIHRDHIDVEDIDTLVNYTKDLLDPERLRAALEQGSYKAIQEKNNAIAYEQKGVWFMPAFRSDDGRKLDARGGEGVTDEEIKALLEDA